MQRDVDALKEELHSLEKDQQELASRITFLARKIDALSRGEEAATPILAEKFLAEPVKTVPPASQPEPVRVSKEKKPPRSDNLEFRIGGTWFSRIGVVAVIVALSFFLKYAIDNQWIGPTGRVVLGLLAGVVMLVAGEKLRKKYPGYAQILLGGGSLALYFSIYAGYSFYGLYPSFLAFALLVLVMANTVFMAVRHNSLPIGILGIIGAYSIPFVIESAEPSLWTLYSYLTVVTAGVLSVSIYKKWPIFQYLSFIFNQLILLFTHDMVPNYFWPSFLFVFVIFAFYLGIATIYNIRHRFLSTEADLVLIVLNAGTFFAWSTYLLQDTFIGNYMGYYAVFLAVVYLYIGKMSYTFIREDMKRVYTLFLISFILITIAIPIQLNAYWIGYAWFAEALGLSLIAYKLNSRPAMYGAIAVFFLGWFEFAFEAFSLREYRFFFFNPPTFLFLFGIGVSYLMMRLSKKVDWPQDRQRFVPGILNGILLVLIFIGINVENSDFFSRQARLEYFLSPEQLSLSALWLLYALILFAYGMRRKKKYLRYGALGLMAITIIKAFLVDLANLSTLFKIILFIILGLFLLGVSFYYQRKKDIIKDEHE